MCNPTSIPTRYGELADLYIKTLDESDRWRALYYSEVKMSNEILCELVELKKTNLKYEGLR
jgi:hypothetical protein